MSAGGGARRLRVVHVITTLTTGGAERQVELLASASRHDVSVVALYEGGVVADALRRRDIRVDILAMDGWRKPAAIVRLSRLLRHLRPDVVHVHLLSAQLWGIPAARLAGVPVVVSSEHSIMETTIEGRAKTPQLRYLYQILERLATHTIAVSDATARRLAQWGVQDPRRLTVINPPIDFDVLNESPPASVRTELNIPDDAFVIGSVGRLDPVKRYDRLVSAMADQLGPRVRLVIAGHGSQRVELEQLVAELGVGDFVHLLGPRADVRSVLGSFDLFVSPSRDETFGMAIVEAVGAGLPVIYAQCPALDGLGLDPQRVTELARSVGDEAERGALIAAVTRMRDDMPGLAPVPGVLVERYGVLATAARVDGLYERLARVSR